MGTSMILCTQYEQQFVTLNSKSPLEVTSSNPPVRILGHGEPVGDPLLDVTIAKDSGDHKVVQQVEKMECNLPLKAEDTNMTNMERKMPVKNPILEKSQGDPLLNATRMNETDVHKVVREAYASRIMKKTCGTSCCQKVLWCPSLIDAMLLRSLPCAQNVPVWSNSVDQHGMVSQVVAGALDKRARITKLKRSGFVVYIGDSATDLAALVEADLGY
jgi:hypothetical protein